ncbi:hypothetical protein B0H14DRAFT_2804500, partial [Mycena olivaceomarginata]
MYGLASTSATDPSSSASLRVAWAHHLAGKSSPTKIAGADAIKCEDLLNVVLFAQRKKKSPRKTTLIPTLSQQQIEISSADADAFQADFERLKLRLYASGQDYHGLLRVLSEFFRGQSGWCERTLGPSTRALSAFQWSLSAYCILLAPWSAVRIRTHSFNADSAREMSIHANRDIVQDEFIYELAGHLGADLASKSKHTDLSTMRSSDKKRRIIFGPIRWVNHHCNANTQYYLLNDNNPFAITLKAIQVTVDYGADFFPAGECLCSACAPPPPAADLVPPQQSPSDSVAQKAKKRAKSHKRRDLQRQNAKEKNEGGGKNL